MRFEVNGAPAGLAPVGDDAFQATAACGMVVTQIEGPSPEDATDADRRALVEAVDDWYDDPHGAPDWRRAMTLRLAEQVREELA